MPIANYTDSVTEEQENNNVIPDGTGVADVDSPDNVNLDGKVQRDIPEYKTVAVYHDKEDLGKVIPYLSGSKLTLLNYFNQIRNTDDTKKLPDSFADNVSMQYTLIKNLIINTDDEIGNGNPGEVVGTALLDGGFKPYKGDVFTVRLLGGKTGLFIIDEIELNSYIMRDVFKITFSLNIFIDEDDTTYRDLLSKSARVVYFNKDYRLNGNAPLYNSDTRQLLKEAKKRLTPLINEYFNRFLDIETKTLLVPCLDGVKATDPNLEDFLFKIIQSTDSEQIKYITRTYPLTDSEASGNVFDAILNSSVLDIKYSPKNVSKSSVLSEGTCIGGILNPHYLNIDTMIDVTNKEVSDSKKLTFKRIM